MGQFIDRPEVYLIGMTEVLEDALLSYLVDTDQQAFYEHVEKVNPTVLVSFYAKLCYKSLVEGKNPNVTKIRSIEDNLRSVINSGHGSVLEHITMNFVITDCSRVFTHELVRHRVGTAFSQTSGRYCAIDNLDIVFDPILEPAKDIAEEISSILEEKLVAMRERLIKPDMDFATKKKITSAIRRFAPNGQTNEIGFTANIRTLRNTIVQRTSRHAEWEIRVVYNQIAELLSLNFPIFMHGGSVELVDGMNEWTGLEV